jgi:hypothetical protein
MVFGGGDKRRKKRVGIVNYGNAVKIFLTNASDRIFLLQFLVVCTKN